MLGVFWQRIATAGKMTRKTKRRLAAAIVLALLAGWAAAQHFYRPWIEALLARTLEEQGFENVQIKVGSAGLSGVTLTDISIGKDMPLLLPRATLHFKPRELWNRRLEEVVLEDVTLEMALGKDRPLPWLPAVRADAPPFALSVTAEEVADLPLRAFELRHARLLVRGEDLSLTLPFSLRFDRDKKEIMLTSDGAQGEAAGRKWRTGKIEASATLAEAEKRWKGSVQAESLQAEDVALALPANLLGALTADAQRLQLQAEIKPVTGDEWRAKLDVDGRFAKEATWKVTLRDASMRWGGGEFRIREMALPTKEGQPIRFALEAEGIGVEPLLALLLKGKVQATGAVGGAIPILLKDGAVTVAESVLAAPGDGVIRVDATALPASENLAALRDVLTDFRYTRFEIGVGSRPDGGLNMRLRVEGRNPQVYGGRQVNLNVNLGGDVLNVVQQSLMPINDPKQLLEGKP